MTLQLVLDPELEKKLRERAAAAQRDVATFVREAIEEKLAIAAAGVRDPATLTPEERRRLWQEWVKTTSEIVNKTVPPGHVADDSRESIYEGRDE